jgi:hypothetical protein
VPVAAAPAEGAPTAPTPQPRGRTSRTRGGATDPAAQQRVQEALRERLADPAAQQQIQEWVQTFQAQNTDPAMQERVQNALQQLQNFQNGGTFQPGARGGQAAPAGQAPAAGQAVDDQGAFEEEDSDE